MTAVLPAPVPPAPDFAAIRSRLQEADAWERSRIRWLLQTALHPDPEKRRPQQVVVCQPDEAGFEDWWDIEVWIAGRGYGKTRIGAEDVSNYCRLNPGHRYAGVFQTFADGRDVAVEGESGILQVVPPAFIKDWNRSLGELIFVNDSRFDIYTSEKPDGLRGPQHHRAWVDEPAKFRYLTDTWSNLIFGLRLGDHPRALVTGTPKPIGLIRDFLSREGKDVKVVRGSSMENRHNLAPSALAAWERLYAGSPLYLQEILGQVLDDYPGALWSRTGIQETRLVGVHGNHMVDGVPDRPVPILTAGWQDLGLTEIAIGVDPSGYSPELAVVEDLGALGGFGKETGIVVVGTNDNVDPQHVYVLEDLSGRYAGETWGKILIDAYYRWTDRGIPTQVVPERNLGGPMVLATVRLSDPQHRVRIFTQNGKPGVIASEGKRARAEAPGVVYADGRAHHLGQFTELEDVLCTWDPSEKYSPDRMDALVWAITALEPWALPAEAGTGLDAMNEIAAAYGG